MLEKFRQIKLREIRQLASLAENGSLPPVWKGARPSFKEALRPSNGLPSIIAEYKRASPSRGSICNSVSAAEAVRQYMQNGAAALSILTEREWFGGCLQYIHEAHDACGQMLAPILRKDFILDPLQIAEAATAPASAILLIVRLTPNASVLRNLREEAASFGMESVVEIFDPAELALARDSGAEIIQVNARNLENLKVDNAACIKLIEAHPPKDHEKWIAASGIEKNAQLQTAASAGFDAVLVGSFLMSGGEPGKALQSLLKGDSHAT